MTDFILRNQTLKIENASDLLAEELVNLLQKGIGDRTGRVRVAELVCSACPSIPANLVNYRLRTYPDGSFDDSGTVMALDIDEIAAFSKAMTVAMAEQRLDRLKNAQVDNSRKQEVKTKINELEKGIKKLKENLATIEIDVLLRSVTVSTGIEDTVELDLPADIDNSVESDVTTIDVTADNIENKLEEKQKEVEELQEQLTVLSEDEDQSIIASNEVTGEIDEKQKQIEELQKQLASLTKS